MLKTHTGNRIKLWEGVWTCGAWSVSHVDLSKPAGRARQMRRMVAKARRRNRREYWAQCNAPAVPLRYDLPPITMDDLLRVVNGGSLEPPHVVGVDLAHDAPPVRIVRFRDYFEQMVCRNESITVPPGDYSEPFVLPEGAKLPTPEMSPRARVGVRRGTDPEVEAAFRASVATSVSDDAKVDLAGGE